MAKKNCKDYRSDLDDWMSMWDEMCKKPRQEVSVVPAVLDQNEYYTYLELADNDLRVPNPVYPDSVGPDQEAPYPVWTDPDLLKDLEDLKNKLFAVENKLAAKMGGDGKWAEGDHNPDDSKLAKEIRDLKERIGKLSDKLGIENEPSPYVVKKVQGEK